MNKKLVIGFAIAVLVVAAAFLIHRHLRRGSQVAPKPVPTAGDNLTEAQLYEQEAAKYAPEEKTFACADFEKLPSYLRSTTKVYFKNMCDSGVVSVDDFLALIQKDGGFMSNVGHKILGNIYGTAEAIRDEKELDGEYQKAMGLFQKATPHQCLDVRTFEAIRLRYIQSEDAWLVERAKECILKNDMDNYEIGSMYDTEGQFLECSNALTKQRIEFLKSINDTLAASFCNG